MSGIQETIAIGLNDLYRRVREGQYGEGDDFDSDCFLEDLNAEVIDKVE